MTGGGAQREFAENGETADARLLDAARKGSAVAFTEIYHRYSNLVRGALLAHMRYQDVPDAMQETFLAAWRNLARLRDREALGGWLCAIARNTARQHFRARVEVRQPADDPVAPSHAALELLTEIQRLPDAYRETLTLRFVEGMTGPEIAARTGRTPGSVRVNLHRGVQVLRERLTALERRDHA